jgi:serine/threonine protein kinase
MHALSGDQPAPMVLRAASEGLESALGPGNRPPVHRQANAEMVSARRPLFNALHPFSSLGPYDRLTTQASQAITLCIQARWTRIGEPIGKGGFGTVWRVFESSNSVNVAALKVVDVPALLSSGVDSVQLEKDLLREVGLMSRLSHIKGITALLEAFIETSGVVHLVMELCHGPTLQWVLDGRGALSEPEARGITWQLLEVVSHLHAQLTMHRDLKPENVMFQRALPDGAGWREAGSLCGAAVKILDLGLARPLLASWSNDSAHGGGVYPGDRSAHGGGAYLNGDRSVLSRSRGGASASGTALSMLCPTPEGSRHDGALFSNLPSAEGNFVFETSPPSSPDASGHGGRSIFFGPGLARRKTGGRNGEAGPSSPGGSAHSGSLFFSLTEGTVRMDGSGSPPKKVAPPGRTPESPGATLRRRLRRMPNEVNVTPVGTRRYAAPELQSATTPIVALPTNAALAVDIFSVGQMLRYMLTGLPPGMGHQQYLEKQGVLVPMLKAAVRLVRGKKSSAQPPPRVVLSPARLSAPAKDLIGLLTSKDPALRPTASAAHDHEWLEGLESGESPQT